MFDSDHPHIRLTKFQTYYSFDFYKDSKEGIHGNMPESRGLAMSTSVFVDTELAGDKYNRRSQT